MTDQSPVIIVGAPRSGTSLMQKLIRETSGFVSVPKESEMIWMPYCHPSLNEWQYEGCPDLRITPDVISDIQSTFATQALSADTWRHFDRLGLMERPRLASLLRLTYRALYKPWSRLREAAWYTEAKPGRLVDKSVHAGLWLNLVDAVFPDAHYIHMVRSPETCIPSMIQGWGACDRFRTYQIPEDVTHPRPGTDGWWYFPMPPDWKDHYHANLVDLCAFQWNAINNSILDHLAPDHFNGRVLRVHLEYLCSDPAPTLDQIARLVDVSVQRLHEQGGPLPKVNASSHKVAPDDTTRQKIHDLSGETYLRLTSSTQS